MTLIAVIVTRTSRLQNDYNDHKVNGGAPLVLQVSGMRPYQDSGAMPACHLGCRLHQKV
jgi:hypothetical protein